MRAIDMLQAGGYDVDVIFESGVQVARVKRRADATLAPVVAGAFQKEVMRDIEAAAQYRAGQLMARLAEVYADTKPLAAGETEEGLIALLQMALGHEKTNDGIRWADLMTAGAPVASRTPAARTPVMA